MSERKYDEDLGKALRFTFDLEPLKASISSFGSGTSSTCSCSVATGHKVTAEIVTITNSKSGWVTIKTCQKMGPK